MGERAEGLVPLVHVGVLWFDRESPWELLCFLAEVTRVVRQSDTDEGGGGVLQNESDTLGAPHIKVTHTPDNTVCCNLKVTRHNTK